MMRLLQLRWTAVALGALSYALTTWWVLQPARLVVQAAQAIQAAADADQNGPSGPSWTFHNPEFSQLVAELKAERDAVRARASQLDELEARLKVERQELNAVTQTVYQLRADLESTVTRVTEEESSNLRKLAKMYSTMSPEGASRILKEMEDDQIVKILALMRETESAPILESFGQGKDAARRAAAISNRLRLTVTAPKKTTKP